MPINYEINTPSREGGRVSLKVAASTKIFAGTMVAINADGYAVPATDTEGLKIFGRAESTVDNSSGSNGDAAIVVSRGVFRYANSSAHAVAQANVGGKAYVEDAATVASETTNSVIAGTVLEIDDDGVWVDTVHAEAPQAAADEVDDGEE